MIKAQQVTGDLPASKNVYRNFFKMAWPSAMEALLVGLVGSVDTMMVGTIGTNAITAVGVTHQPKLILLAVIFSLNTGITAVTALGTHFQTSQVVLSGCLRGAGDTSFVAITSFISVAVIRPTLTWLLCYPLGFGLHGAWITLLLDQFFRMATSMKRFSGGKWTTIKL